MIIYEVNLAFEKTISEDFRLWLNEHIAQMLQFSGFIQANLLQSESDDSDQEKLTVHYYLTDREALENYLVNFAPKMRQQGIERFKDKFSAQRRILQIVSVLKTT